MAESIGALRVDLSANSAQFGRDLEATRAHLAKTGASFNVLGGVAGAAGEKLARGLKRGVNDFAELGRAAGLAGGEFAKVGGMIADLALTGFNPISLGIAGIGVAASLFQSKAKDTFEVKVPDALRETQRESEQTESRIHDLRGELDALKFGISPGAASLAVMQAKREELLVSIKTMRDTIEESGMIGGGTALSAEHIAGLRDKIQLRQEESAALAVEISRQQELLGLEQAMTAEKKKAHAEDVRGASTRGDSITSLRAEADAVDDASQAFRDYSEVMQELRVHSAAWRAAQDRREKAKQEVYGYQFEPSAPTSSSLGIMNEDEHAAFALGRKAEGDAVKDETASVRAFSSELANMRREMVMSDAIGTQLAHTLAEGLGSGMAGAIESLERGAKSGKEAMRDFATGVIADLQRVIITSLVTRAAFEAIGFAAGPAPSFAGVGSTSNINGGDYRNTNPYGLKSDQAFGDVHIYESPGAKASVSHERGPDGRKRLKVMITDMVADDIMAGGTVSQAMQAAHGVGRVASRRRS